MDAPVTGAAGAIAQEADQRLSALTRALDGENASDAVAAAAELEPLATELFERTVDPEAFILLLYAGIGFGRGETEELRRRSWTALIRAARGLRQAVLAGRPDLSGQWARAVRALCHLSSRSTPPHENELSSAWDELAPLAQYLASGDSAAIVGSAYASVGSGYATLWDHRRAEGWPRPELHHRAVFALTRGAELIADLTPEDPFAQDRAAARVNLCIALSKFNTPRQLLEFRDATLSALRDPLVAGDDNMKSFVVRLVADAVGAYLDDWNDPQRNSLGRSVTAPVLYLLHPELLEPETFMDLLNRQELFPNDDIQFFASVEFQVITALLSNAENALEAACLIDSLTPPPATGYVFLAFGDHGVPEEDGVAALGFLMRDRTAAKDSAVEVLGRAERVSTGLEAQLAFPSEELCESVNEVLACSGVEAKHKVGFILAAARSAQQASDRWRLDGVAGAAAAIESWLPSYQELGGDGRSLSLVLLPMYVRLAEALPQYHDSISRHLQLVLHRPGGSDVVDLDASEEDEVEYLQARYWGVWSAASDRRTDEHEREKRVTELRREFRDLLERSSVDPQTKDEISARLKHFTVLEPFEGVLVRFRAALSAGVREDYVRAAWELALRAGTVPRHAPEDVKSDLRRAALLVRESADDELDYGQLGVLAHLLSPDAAELAGLSAADRLALLERVLSSRAGQQPSLANLLIDACGSAADLSGDPQMSEQMRRNWEAASSVAFATREATLSLGPLRASNLLAHGALAAVGVHSGSIAEREYRAQMAVAAVVAAVSSDEIRALTTPLYALAESARALALIGPIPTETASVIWDELDRHLATLPPVEVPDDLLEAINHDRASMQSLIAECSDDDGGGGKAFLDGPIDDPAVFDRPEFISSRSADDAWRAIDTFCNAVPARETNERRRPQALFAASQGAIALYRHHGTVHHEIARNLISAALEVAQSPRVQAAHALPLLEVTTFLAIAADEWPLAYEAILSYEAVTSQRVIAASSPEEVLASITSLGWMDEAAILASRKGQPFSAIAAAESARFKLQAVIGAVAEGSTVGLTLGPASALDNAGRERLAELLHRLWSGDDPISTCTALSDELGWLEVATELVVPWRRLSAIGPAGTDSLSPQAFGSSAALGLERLPIHWPTSERFAVWCLGDVRSPIALTVFANLRTLILPDPKDLPTGSSAGDDASAGDDSRAHRAVPLAARFGQAIATAAESYADTNAQAVVLDASRDPLVAVQIAQGIQASRAPNVIVPIDVLSGEPDSWDGLHDHIHDHIGAAEMPRILSSSRLLDARRSGKKDGPSIALFVDPKRDLPGSWLEAAVWAARDDLEVEIYGGRAATREAFFDALCRVAAVVVSCHGTTSGQTGVDLLLADGRVGFFDITVLAPRIRVDKLVLSACWAGASAMGSLRRQAIGLVASLSAAGVGEIIAPVRPVRDLPSAVLGCILGAGFRFDRSLASVFGASRRALNDEAAEYAWDAARFLARLEQAAEDGTLDVPPASLEHLRRSVLHVTLREVKDASSLYGVFGLVE